MQTPGERLKAWRDAQGWTQAELAKRVGLHQGTISRIEKGAAVPDLRSAIELSKLARRRRGRLPVDMWDLASIEA